MQCTEQQRRQAYAQRRISAQNSDRYALIPYAGGKVLNKAAMCSEYLQGAADAGNRAGQQHRLHLHTIYADTARLCRLGIYTDRLNFIALWRMIEE